MSKLFDVISLNEALEHLSKGGKITAVGMIVGEYIQNDEYGTPQLYYHETKRVEQLVSMHPFHLLNMQWYIFE